MKPLAKTICDHLPRVTVSSTRRPLLQAQGLRLPCFILMISALCALPVTHALAAIDTITLLPPVGPPVWTYTAHYVNLLTDSTLTFGGLTAVTDATAPDPSEWTVIRTATEVVFRYIGTSITGEGTLSPFTITSVSPNNIVTWSSAGMDATATGAIAGPAYPKSATAVTVYDNWIGFGNFGGPDFGSASSVDGDFVMPRETPASSWPGTAGVIGSNGYDIAGLRVQTAVRLSLTVKFNGNVHLVRPDGSQFPGKDTRKVPPGDYEMPTQWKVKLFGRYLVPGTETVYYSPNTYELTDFDKWTSWGPDSNDPSDADGWLSASTTDAWTGEPITGTDTLAMTVERMQGVGAPGESGGAAGFWITERVQRRGMQDVQGNYRQDVNIRLTVAE